jgi:hypothetical protein
MLRLVRLLRLGHTLSHGPKMHLERRVPLLYGISNLILMILQVFLFLMFYLHIQACFIFWVGRWTGYYRWDEIITMWTTAGDGIEVASPWTQYTWCMLQVY